MGILSAQAKQYLQQSATTLKPLLDILTPKQVRPTEVCTEQLLRCPVVLH